MSHTRRRILVVEDDASIRRAVVDHFQAQGWEVDEAMDGELGLEKALSEVFDCIVLDLMLPRVHGYEICEAIRREGKEVPIIMVTAKGEERDVVRGFEIGTTDYVRKPFSLAELTMRVKVHLDGASEELLSVGKFQLDSDKRILSGSGEEIELTDKECGVLVCLVKNAGRVYSREALLNEVWGSSWSLGERSVDRCVKTLRKKLGEDSRTPQWLKTIRQVGYVWEE